MGKFKGDKKFSLEEIREIFKQGELSQLVHAETVFNIHEHENVVLNEELANLVKENAEDYGGSPWGYIFGGQVFCIKGGWQQSGIKLIHEDLREKAAHVKNNRSDVRQYLTYIAHLLGRLDELAETSIVAYCANIPRGLLEFSPSLKALDRDLASGDGIVYADSKFKRDDPRAAAYFLHFDRVDQPINRFLFRRITR